MQGRLYPFQILDALFRLGSMLSLQMGEMKKAVLLLLSAALASTSITAPAHARKGDDQVKAREQMNSGKVLSLREIEGRVVPRMRGMEYLGPEYDGSAQVYRLKFIDSGRVIFVDVDARSGSVLRQR